MGQPQSALIPPIPVPIPLIPGLRPTPVDPNRKPQPGDHIYTDRAGGVYQHHGIYVGDDMVIHLQGAAKKIGPPSPCPKCRDKLVCNGEIVKTCLDCFLDNQPLKFYEYGVSVVVFQASKRGTCSVSHSKPAHEVIKAATDFLDGSNGFGRYDLFVNNCEDFAVYCKTGQAVSMQVMGHVMSAGPIGLPVLAAYGIAKAITNAQRR